MVPRSVSEKRTESPPQNGSGPAVEESQLHVKCMHMRLSTSRDTKISKANQVIVRILPPQLQFPTPFVFARTNEKRPDQYQVLLNGMTSGLSKQKQQVVNPETRPICNEAAPGPRRLWLTASQCTWTWAHAPGSPRKARVAWLAAKAEAPYGGSNFVLHVFLPFRHKQATATATATAVSLFPSRMSEGEKGRGAQEQQRQKENTRDGKANNGEHVPLTRERGYVHALTASWFV